METVRYSLLRDLLAVVIAMVVCPVAVFGGANLGCVGATAFSGSCALTVIFVSPLVLWVGGVLAGISSRGWTGLMLVLVGTFLGMVVILALSELAGKPVPIGWFDAMAASVFFGGPIVVGYGMARLASRLLAMRRS